MSTTNSSAKCILCIELLRYYFSLFLIIFLLPSICKAVLLHSLSNEYVCMMFIQFTDEKHTSGMSVIHRGRHISSTYNTTNIFATFTLFKPMHQENRGILPSLIHIHTIYIGGFSYF